MSLNSFFHLKENNTKVHTEIIAGLTTFFAMAYILAVNPNVLGAAGIPTGAVYLATVIATCIGCLLLGLFANVPLAQSAGLGLNAFFTYTVVFTLGFTWQEALAMVFICGILNMIITMTKIRTYLIASIPKVLKVAIGCGIGLFIAYIGLLNVKFLDVTGACPMINWTGLATDPVIWVFLIGMILTIILAVLKVKGAFLIGIIATTLIGLIPVFGVTDISSSVSIGEAFSQLPETFCVIFTSAGIPSLFSIPLRIPLVIITIITFSLIDMFDTIGTIIGAGREMNLFSDAEIEEMKTGKRFHTRTERALVADATATTIGSLFGTSNVTTYVESAAGVEAGGRTGLTAVVTAICFAICILLVPLATAVPSAATAPVLVLVGILMLKPFAEVEWKKLEVAIPCFFTSVFMALCYSITDGIAIGFFTYCLIMICKRRAKEVHPLVWVIAVLFFIYMLMRALIVGGVLAG
ncbi:MAG TPA: NCS2 family permease, partial [Methanocorpusculum sp.]|nr:NCS2 family permease [Methanocorpusculum sp.]